ncbi:MAG: hypothetical protein RLO81_06315, partial [Fulvivirga sp.]
VSYFNKEIVIINVDGTNYKNITNTTCREFYPRWSPDGEKILFMTTCESVSDIFTMNVDGTNRKRITWP